MKRGQTTDEASGLNNRATFLDIANAEFSRSRRYDHDLTLVVTDVIGLEKITEQHGYEALDQTMMAVGQMCLSSRRFGVDVLGRITENQIAIMLPETALAGGLKFMARMRDMSGAKPIPLISADGKSMSADEWHSKYKEAIGKNDYVEQEKLETLRDQMWPDGIPPSKLS